MILTPMADKQIHLGRNVKRIREIMGIKQDALAADLDISQQSVSLLEQKADIDDRMLERIAGILKVPADAIKNFSEEATVNYINTFHDQSINNGAVGSSLYHCSFNPIDKIVELYERLLQAEKEKNAAQ